MNDLAQILDPTNEAFNHAWDRAYLTKCLIEVSRIALESESPDMSDQVRLDRVSEVLRIAAYLADLAEEDAAGMWKALNTGSY